MKIIPKRDNPFGVKIQKEMIYDFELLDHISSLYLESLKRRAKLLTDTFNGLTGVTCVPATGAMYLFPRFEFPEKMIKEAEFKGIEADTFYALELLNSTGVVNTIRLKFLILIFLFRTFYSVWSLEADFVKKRVHGI